MTAPMSRSRESCAANLSQRGLSLGHIFPVAAHPPTATWASASNRRKTVAGSPGCQMSTGRKLSRTPTVDIAMNPRDLWITQRLRLRARKISSRPEPLSFSSPTSRRSRFFRRKVAPRPSARGMSARLCRQAGGTITQGSRAWRTLAASCSESKGFGRKNIPGSHRSPG
jgi:hypothetical protein